MYWFLLDRMGVMSGEDWNRVERCFGFGGVFVGSVARRIRIFRGIVISVRVDIPMILSALVKERVTEK